MRSISRDVKPEMLRRAGIKLVFIGLGSHAMIKSYKRACIIPSQNLIS